MSAYYNENNPFSAEWLRQLIKAGAIEDGEVDERSIVEVRPADLRRFTRCHFFAGIGVWAYALDRAGFPKDEQAWTGSCPCQPFSVSGKRRRASDGRHLWPTWFNLIRESQPERIFGEQVASDDGLAWLDLVQANLENEGYACGAVNTCACGFGAPHIRQRIYFVADSTGGEPWYKRTGPVADARWFSWEHSRLDVGETARGSEEASREQRLRSDDGASCATGTVADAERNGRWTDESRRGPEGREADGRDGEAGDVADAERRRCEQCDASERGVQQFDADGNMGVSIGEGLEGYTGNGDGSNESGRQRENATRPASAPGPLNGFWADAEWLYCRDGKYRPAKSGIFPLASRTSGRVGKLRGYGNALVAQQAEAFIKAYLEEIK